jgi:DNA ligase-1
MNSADLYRATVKVTATDGEKRNLIYNVFDILPKTDLYNGICETECELRKDNLQKLLEKVNLPHIRPVSILYAGEEIGKINELCDKYTNAGGEGVMINIANAPYECKRTKNLLKVKRFNSADVRVLSWEEGTGANKGKLGAVIVEFIAPDGKTYTCKVGSGFEKDEREQFFADPSQIVGHIIEIGYFELSKNQNDDGYSLRFPTFKCLRHDKNEISMH